jgi:DNA-binding transcriptional LysR family regulator
MSTAALKDLNKLSTFVRVAERRSFTKAAEDLRTTPSVVSNRMKELEASLGFRLMNRSTHGIVLTDAGEGFFQNCLEMLARLDAYVIEARNIHAGPVGTLRVQATSDYARWVLAPLIPEFARRYPSLRVHVSVVEDGCTSANEGVDVIVASKKPSAPGLAGEDLGPIPHAICASPDYFKRLGRPREPQELREHNCLANLFSGATEWPFKIGARPLVVSVKGSLSSNSYAVLIQMAVQGCGIIRIPRHAIEDELKAKKLELIFEGSSSSPERIAIYFSKVKNLPMKTTEFIQFLRTSIAPPGRRSTADPLSSRAG